MNFFRRRKREDANEARDDAPQRDANEARETGESDMSQLEPTQADSIGEGHDQTAEPGQGGSDRSAEARPMPGSRPAGEVRDDVIAVLKTVYDPEIPVDIYELGLIYDVDVEPTGDVAITMTLTTPMCPVAETLPPEVEAKVRDVPGVTHVQLELVWEPPWSMDMMSEAARLELNL